MKSLLAFLTVFLLASAPAYALRLSNCDTTAQTFIIDYYGSEMKITLEPGSSRLLTGRAREVELVGGERISLWRPHDEYCSKNGKITLQRRKKNNKKVR